MHKLSQKQSFVDLLQPFFLLESLRCGRDLISSPFSLVGKPQTRKTFKFGIEPIFKRLGKLKLSDETWSLVKVWDKFWMIVSTDSSETFVPTKANSVNVLHLVTSVFNWSSLNFVSFEICYKFSYNFRMRVPEIYIRNILQPPHLIKVPEWVSISHHFWI